MIRLSVTARTGGVLMSLNELVCWVWIGVSAAKALGALSELVTARLGGTRLAALPASAWSTLLLYLAVLSFWSLILGHLGHLGHDWLPGSLLLVCAVTLVLQWVPGIVSRRKAGLPWWQFWPGGPSSAAGSAGLGNPEDSPEL